MKNKKARAPLVAALAIFDIIAVAYVLSLLIGSVGA